MGTVILNTIFEEPTSGAANKQNVSISIVFISFLFSIGGTILCAKIMTTNGQCIVISKCLFCLFLELVGSNTWLIWSALGLTFKWAQQPFQSDILLRHVWSEDCYLWNVLDVSIIHMEKHDETKMSHLFISRMEYCILNKVNTANKEKIKTIFKSQQRK